MTDDILHRYKICKVCFTIVPEEDKCVCGNTAFFYVMTKDHKACPKCHKMVEKKKCKGCKVEGVPIRDVLRVIQEQEDE